MQPSLIVRGIPQEYECTPGAWNKLENHLLKRNYQRIMIVQGKRSWQAAQPFFPALSSCETYHHYYGGACTAATIGELVKKLQQISVDAVIAVGGGKVIDVAKAAANAAQLPVIILPTLAATCAACTPLSVIYNDAGIMEKFAIYPRSNTLLLIEPQVILSSPIELMVAGIGDTLAKWYEADALIAPLPDKSVPIQIAAFAARRCRDILLAHSEAALESMHHHRLTTDFIQVVETNILLAGMVGGFGDEQGRTAGAHTIHDALTLLPASHRQLHGNKVAYGILVQLVIENKWQEIDQLIPFYQHLSLPTCLTELGIPPLSEQQYQQVAQHACRKEEAIHYMQQPITEACIIQAMKQLEHYRQKQ